MAMIRLRKFIGRRIVRVMQSRWTVSPPLSGWGEVPFRSTVPVVVFDGKNCLEVVEVNQVEDEVELLEDIPTELSEVEYLNGKRPDALNGRIITDILVGDYWPTFGLICDHDMLVCDSPRPWCYGAVIYPRDYLSAASSIAEK